MNQFTSSQVIIPHSTKCDDGCGLPVYGWYGHTSCATHAVIAAHYVTATPFNAKGFHT